MPRMPFPSVIAARVGIRWIKPDGRGCGVYVACMRGWQGVVAVVLALIVLVAVGTYALGVGGPSATGEAAVTPRVTTTCSTHETQAEAQKAKDTLDADGDGVYCEANPCPCSGRPDDGSSPRPTTIAQPATSVTAPATPTAPPAGGEPANCTVSGRVARIGLSKTKYPRVRTHWERAIRQGWPRVLTVNRVGAKERRSALLRGVPTKPGFDRDEYPMAMARDTVGANVELVPSSQNRGAGSVQGIKLRRYCSGQRFEIVWY